MNKFIKLLTLIAVASLVGCATAPYKPYARTVKTKPQQGGVIALYAEHRDEDRAKAQGMMAANCGSNAVTIVEEGEVVIGTATKTTGTQDNYSTTPAKGKIFGIPYTTSDSTNQINTNSSTVQQKEWQITYECKSVATNTTTKKKAAN